MIGVPVGRRYAAFRSGSVGNREGGHRCEWKVTKNDGTVEEIEAKRFRLTGKDKEWSSDRLAARPKRPTVPLVEAVA